MARKDAYEIWKESGELTSKLAIIQSLSMQGYAMDKIAEKLEISERTLQRLQEKYSDIKKAIGNGRLKVVAQCQSALMERVKAGDTTAIIYALKVYGEDDFFNDRKEETRIKREELEWKKQLAADDKIGNQTVSIRFIEDLED